VTEKH